MLVYLLARLSLQHGAPVAYFAVLLSACRFFPAAMYLSTSKLAVAAVGNLSFAVALCMYNLVIKVRGYRKSKFEGSSLQPLSSRTAA
jgi:hypothetical protein